jgi:hypothetical protein
MPTDHILALLIAERDKLNRAIEALSGLANGRGRPPKKALAAAPSAAPPPAASAPAKKKRHFSAAQRAAAAERMRQRWAAKRMEDGQAAKQATA